MLFCVGCSKDDANPQFEIPTSDFSIFGSKGVQRIKDTTSYSLDNDHPAIKIMQERSKRIARIMWSAKGPIPSNSGYFHTGKSYMGIPYSSVKELNKFVGQDVSFQTFLAAVNNPKSVLYTENVAKSPYKGTNCSSFYGTVCSMTVNYALGLNRPFSTEVYDTLPSFKKLTQQNFNALAPGDIVWKKSHVVLVTRVERNSIGNVQRLEILESNGMGTSLINYTLEDFSERWRGFDWIIYRYSDLASIDDNYDSFLWNESFLGIINEDLSLTRGNWVTYREGEQIIANVLSSRFSTLEVKKNGNVIQQKAVIGPTDISFSFFNHGVYQMRLTDGEQYSGSVDFEVINTNVSVTKSHKWLKIYFSSVNAEPEFFIFCDEKGAPFFIADLTELDKSRGYAFVKCEKSVKGLFVKVFFKGVFGRVSNAIIPLD